MIIFLYFIGYIFIGCIIYNIYYRLSHESGSWDSDDFFFSTFMSALWPIALLIGLLWLTVWTCNKLARSLVNKSINTIQKNVQIHKVQNRLLDK